MKRNEGQRRNDNVCINVCFNIQRVEMLALGKEGYVVYLP